MKFEIILLLTVFSLIAFLSKNTESRSVSYNFHSDAIVTHWPTPIPAETLAKPTKEEEEPGWMVTIFNNFLNNFQHSFVKHF